MRRILATAGLALLVAIPFPSGVAVAHPEHGVFVEWRSPEEGERVSGARLRIQAKVAFGRDGVRSWAVEVAAPTGARHHGYGTICQQVEGGSPLYVMIDCPWDTTGYPDGGGVAHNGSYLVRITAENGRREMFSPPSESHTAERGVTVVNPVSPPTDVRLSFSETERQITVRWAPNPEPDIVRYVVQERFRSEGWRKVGETGGKVTSFTRQVSAAGTYRYRVAALRSAGGGNDTLQSAYSEPTSNPREITAPEPPATTTTTTPAGPEEDAGPGTGPIGEPGLPAPLEGGGPAPEAGGVPGDGAADPGSRQAAASTPGAVVTPIQPGRPGSVGSRQTSPGNLVQRGAPPPTSAPEVDGGFSETLPYPSQVPPEAPGDEGISRVLVGLPEVIANDDRRGLLISLATGLLLFVFAAHAFYLSRAASPQEPLEVE